MSSPLHPLLDGVHLECRDGRFNIIRVLCEQLQDQTDRFGTPQSQVRDVKEKYGALHFYADHCSQTQGALIEFAEDLSVHTCEVRGKAAMLRGLGWIQRSAVSTQKRPENDGKTSLGHNPAMGQRTAGTW